MNDLTIIPSGIPLTEHVRYTPTGMRFDGDVSLEEWGAQGQVLAYFGKSLMWLYGDWQAYGVERFGEKASQYFEEMMMRIEAVPSSTGKKYGKGTMANALWVCKHVPPENRVDALTFSHHYEVASLEPHEQQNFLHQAEQESWTVRQLRDAVYEHKFGAGKPNHEDKYKVLAKKWRDRAENEGTLAISKTLIGCAEELETV